MRKMLLGLMLTGLLASNAPAEEIWKSPWFICIYGKDFTINTGEEVRPMLVGDSIKCYSPRGVYCGVGVLEPNITYFNTILRYSPIYGEDPWQNGDNGVHIKDTVYFRLKYQEIVNNGRIWKETQAIPVDSAMRSAYAPIVVKEWSDIENKVFGFKTTCCLSKGDVNMDGLVDIEDLTQLIQYLNFDGKLKCFDAADLDNDNNVDIADLTIFIDYLFISLNPPSPC